jgi:hypothetical protein
VTGDPQVTGDRQINAAADRLAAILESVPPRLTAIPDAEAARERAPGRWSKKQILGHLIDSASNNHQRIVRTLQAPRLDFPAYEQETWVAVQGYATESWPGLTGLWVHLNRHLLHIIRTIPESGLSHECAIGGKPPMALTVLIASYLDHLDHHLDQVLAGG